MSTPPLPPGFVLESASKDIPPLPPGFELEQDEGRIWDQPAVRAEAPNPTDEMGTGERIAAAIGGNYVGAYRGLKQSATELLSQPARNVERFYGLLGLGDAVAPEFAPIHESLARQQATIDEAKRLDAPLNATRAGFAGNVIGGVSQLAIPGAALRHTRARSAFLPSTTRGNALQGAFFGAAQPVATGESRALNTGIGFAAGGVGTAIPGLVKSGVRGLSGLVPAATQRSQTRAAADVLNQFAANPAALRAGATNPQIIVPGTRPTLAETSGDSGLAGLQKILSADQGFSNRLSDQIKGNNLQRVREVERAFGGADDDAADAIRARTRTAELPGLAEARKQTGAESGRIVSWIDRVGNSPRFRNNPNVEQALGTVRNMISVPIDDAGRLSAARGIVTESLNNPRRMSSADFNAVREARRLVISGQQQGRAADEVLRDLGKLKPTSLTAAGTINDMRRSLKTIERGKPDVASLYATRMHITQTLMKNADGATMEALRGAVKQLDERIGAVAPSYKQYLTNFAAGMREADRVSVGAELLATGRAVRTATNDPDLTAAAFGRAAGNMDRTVQRATGFRRATAERTLTAEQRGAVDAVRRDLERFARSREDVTKIGSDTYKNAVGGNSFQSAVGPVGAAMVEPASGIAMMAVNQMRAKYGGQVAELVQEAMLNPARAAEILASVPPSQRAAVVRAVAPLLARTSAVIGTVAPTLSE